MEFIVKGNMILKDALINEYSKKYVRYLKRQNAIFYKNNEIIKNYEQVYNGDLIKIEFESTYQKEEILYDLNLDIIYEDFNFMIVNKPANLNTIPSKLEPQKSLYNAIYTYLFKNNKLNTIHIITRLDNKTSGLVLVALNKETALFLNKNHSSMHKIYYAKAIGIINEDTFIINKPILKVDYSIKRIISNVGKESITSFEVLKRYEDSTLLKCILHTGRTHQIRIHLASISHPILGDDLYGNTKGLLRLCCNELSFIGPENINYSFKLPLAVWMKD